MSTKLHKPITKRDQELARIASALLSFADHTSDFADWLHQQLPATNDSAGTLPAQDVLDALPGVVYFIPRDTAHAITLTHWLLATTTAQAHPYTTALLATWAERRLTPKDQIFGIIGIAIIGPTLGLIKSKKKKKSQLRIVLPHDVYKTTAKSELVALTQTISGEAVAAELRQARGRVAALHPDTADWLMSDHTTTLYTADSQTYAAIEHTLTTCDLPHLRHPLTDSTTALGISPSLSDSFLADFAVTAVTD